MDICRRKSVLESISRSLKSSCRPDGPRLQWASTGLVHGNPGKPYSDFAFKQICVRYNDSVPELYKHALSAGDTSIASNGALVAYSGKKTGRSPLDKRLAESQELSKHFWTGEGTPNVEMSTESFQINRETAICFLNSQSTLFVVDGFAGWDPETRIKVRVIATLAYHALFMRNMLIRPSAQELATFGDPDYTIYNAGCFPCNRFSGKNSSSTSVGLNFDTKEVVILGTQYAGEMKKAVFTIMNFIMPLAGNLASIPAVM